VYGHRAASETFDVTNSVIGGVAKRREVAADDGTGRLKSVDASWTSEEVGGLVSCFDYSH
jgi:hypothetical protein